MRPWAAAALLAGALIAGLAPGPAGAAMTAVLVGVDDYKGPPPLQGAVNDVRDLAAVLRAAGASVEVLEDSAADRAAVLDAVERAAEAAGPDDLVYVHFSGHGISIEDLDGDEADGRDEAYLLHGFDEVARPGEMLVDDDLDRLFAALGRDVLFVADACHSGSPARRVAGPALPTRLYRPKADPARPPPPQVAAASGSPQVYAVGATTDDRSVPEILIDGRPRGALSYAAARALAGAGDLDGDGRLAMREFEIYVRQAVRALAASKQTPQFAGPEADRILVEVAATTRLPVADDGLPVMSVHVLAGAGGAAVTAALAAMPGVALSDSPEAATLLVDPVAGAVQNGVRDVILEGRPSADLLTVIDTQRVLAAVTAASLGGSPGISLAPDDGILAAGTRIGFTVEAVRHPHLTVFALSADGTAHWLWPLSDRDQDPWPAGRAFTLEAEVSPPFGADTLVVVATERPPEALRAALAALDGARRPLLLHEALAATRRVMATQIGVQAFFTAETVP